MTFTGPGLFALLALAVFGALCLFIIGAAAFSFLYFWLVTVPRENALEQKEKTQQFGALKQKYSQIDRNYR